MFLSVFGSTVEGSVFLHHIF